MKRIIRQLEGAELTCYLEKHVDDNGNFLSFIIGKKLSNFGHCSITFTEEEFNYLVKELSELTKENK